MKNIYSEITGQIVAAIERGNLGEWRMPWHTSGEFVSSPINAASKKPYRGVNIIALWAAAETAGYSRGEWATYQQWKSAGAQVRKGERSTLVVFWKFSTAESIGDDEQIEDENENPQTIILTRGYHVFNVAQVDNAPAAPEPETTEKDRIETADVFFKNIGADIRHGGNRAYYSPLFDYIQMPPYAAFPDPAAYVSVVKGGVKIDHWGGEKVDHFLGS